VTVKMLARKTFKMRWYRLVSRYYRSIHKDRLRKITGIPVKMSVPRHSCARALHTSSSVSVEADFGGWLHVIHSCICYSL